MICVNVCVCVCVYCRSVKKKNRQQYVEFIQPCQCAYLFLGLATTIFSKCISHAFCRLLSVLTSGLGLFAAVSQQLKEAIKKKKRRKLPKRHSHTNEAGNPN